MRLQVGVKLLIKNSAGQYLLLRRSEPLPDGTGIKWDIPGGRIHAFERLEEALAREVAEEINIKFNGSVKLLKAQDIMLPDIDLHIVRLTYTTELNERVELSQEHQNFTWITPGEALALNVDPYLREVLESV